MRMPLGFLFGLVVWAGCAFGSQSIEQVDPASIPPNPTFTNDVAPIINFYCVGCHDSNSPFSEEPDLSSFANVVDEYGSIEEEFLLERKMPPAGAQRPTPREEAIVNRWAEQGFAP